MAPLSPHPTVVIWVLGEIAIVHLKENGSVSHFGVLKVSNACNFDAHLRTQQKTKAATQKSEKTLMCFMNLDFGHFE